MISLSDQQLSVVMTAARALEPERRSIFLEQVGAMLRLRRRFNDDDVAQVAQLALHGRIRPRDPKN